jgi:hypothetical protein
MKSPDSEMRRLTDAWHDGTISPEEGMRLERRITTESHARDYFFGIAEIEAAMAEAALSLPREIPDHAFARRSNGRKWGMAAVFVAGLFCGALVLESLPSPQPAALAAKAPAAVVTGMLGVSWDGASPGQSITIPAGSAESGIGAGLLELTFASGTRALVEGPASFQVTGDNAIRLAHGKLVADVPKGAEGFSVTYPDGKIVDLGTEFGVEIARNGRSANFGVFRGEIEFHPAHDAAQVIHLPENHAILFENGSSTSVPFDQEKFTRKLPSREFAWEIKGSTAEQTVLDYDISHLIWKPGRYRAICKWMAGSEDLAINGAELLLDGQPVQQDFHSGVTGKGGVTRDNMYELAVSPNAYRRGRWTLRIHARAETGSARDAGSSGVVLFEEGLALHAKASDFLGTWEYLHDGMVYRRTFHADGSASLMIDGLPYGPYETSHWEASGGTLVLNVIGNGTWLREQHLLRDSETLIFVNCPYRNATRVKP